MLNLINFTITITTWSDYIRNYFYYMVNNTKTVISTNVEDTPWRAGISFSCRLNFW